MKNLLLFLTLIFAFFTTSAQEFADFTLTGTHQGTGTFTNATLSDFTWQASGTLAQEVQILDDEVFDDGNAFENTFGQADYAENLRLQVYPNGEGTAGQPILSKATLTLNFDETTPAEGWGFCLVDIDVEQCLITAIDENDNEVPVEDIDSWLIELFDANMVSYGVNIPKWDATHAALLGSDTPTDYTVYDSLVIGGLNDSEAAAAFFMPDIPLKSLTIKYENLQEVYFTSYHFYIASAYPTGTPENDEIQMKIYPNPATNAVNIQLEPLSQHSSTVEIYDLNGRKLLEKQIPKGSEEVTVDVRGLAPGMYLAKLQSGGRIGVSKLIVQ